MEPLRENPRCRIIVGGDVPERREPVSERVWCGEDAPPRLKTSWITPKDVRLGHRMFVPLLPEPEKIFNGLLRKDPDLGNPPGKL